VNFNSHTDAVVTVAVALVNVATPGEAQGRPYEVPAGADLVAGVAAWLREIAPATGASGGLFAAVIVMVVLAVTISAAPLAPGATRPGLRDLFWTPLLALLVVLGLCAVAGWYGARAGLVVARRRKT